MKTLAVALVLGLFIACRRKTGSVQPAAAADCEQLRMPTSATSDSAASREVSLQIVPVSFWTIEMLERGSARSSIPTEFFRLGRMTIVARVLQQAGPTNVDFDDGEDPRDSQRAEACSWTESVGGMQVRFDTFQERRLHPRFGSRVAAAKVDLGGSWLELQTGGETVERQRAFVELVRSMKRRSP